MRSDAMSFDVVSAEYRGDYRIHVTFENGRSGEVDVRRFIERGGVYAPLRDENFLKRFHIDEEFGVLAWGDRIDIAPETLYAEATGEPLPAWVERQEG
jgi:hypothetical protein